MQSPALSSQPTLCRPRVQTLRHQDGPGVTRTNGALLPHSNPDTVNTNKDAEWFVWTMEQHHVDMWSLIVRRRLEKMWHCRWCIFPLIFSTAEKSRYRPTSYLLPCPCWENRYVHPSGLTGSVRLHLPFLQIPTSDTNISKSKYFRGFNLEPLATGTF